MNYGRQVLLDVPNYPTGGMAAPDVNPRGGIFGPQGYGGGVFDGSMHGLGQTTNGGGMGKWIFFGALAAGAAWWFFFREGATGVGGVTSKPAARRASIPTVRSKGGGRKHWFVIVDGDVSDARSKADAEGDFEMFRDELGLKPKAIYYGTEKQAEKYAGS
jgi:hypothetical protein